MRGKITFITGGARSGKSSFALKIASKRGRKKAFIATSEPIDEEMKNRILRHKKERPPDWTTFEEPIDISALINNIKRDYDSILIDCLTIWLSNIFHRGLNKDTTINGLISALREPPSDIYIVSNEIGMGIVPESPTTREFRDMAGRLNQMIASIADEVYLVVSGIPIKIKGEDYGDT